MTSKDLWRQMENLALREQSLERDIEFMLLLKKAYEKDLNLIIACVYDAMMPGMARQGYMDVGGKRMLVCYTSKQRAKQAKYEMEWDIAGAQELMNNMFNKEKIMGMVFNPADENMVIVLKEILADIMPGDKPKPEFFKE